MIKPILISLRNAAATKLIFFLVSAVASIPIASLFYWSFDSSYLGAFGIGPEFYSRPVFSSDLIKTWAFITALKPSVSIVSSVSATIFFGLLYLSYRPTKITTETPAQDESKVLIFIDKSEKAGHVAAAFLLICLVPVLALSLGFSHFSEEGLKLARKQIASYVNEGDCYDLFNIDNKGCYSIPGEQGNTQLLVLNDEKHLIYMTRELDSSSLETSSEAKPAYKMQVVVKHKATNEKIIRQYLPSAAKEKLNRET